MLSLELSLNYTTFCQYEKLSKTNQLSTIFLDFYLFLAQCNYSSMYNLTELVKVYGLYDYNRELYFFLSLVSLN